MYLKLSQNHCESRSSEKKLQQAAVLHHTRETVLSLRQTYLFRAHRTPRRAECHSQAQLPSTYSCSVRTPSASHSSQTSHLFLQTSGNTIATRDYTSLLKYMHQNYLQPFGSRHSAEKSRGSQYMPGVLFKAQADIVADFFFFHFWEDNKLDN